MTTEELKLLYKDICARLPYGVQAKVDGHYNPLRILGIERLSKNTWAWRKGIYVVSFQNDTKCIDQVKPYLRPVSSMTKEECITLSKLIPYEVDAWKYVKTPVPLFIANIEQFDFFHRLHLDWIGLIPKGLALEAPEGMYD